MREGLSFHGSGPSGGPHGNFGARGMTDLPFAWLNIGYACSSRNWNRTASEPSRTFEVFELESSLSNWGSSVS